MPVLVFGACGAAVLYRRRMVEEIGFLDKDFFLYDEDTDLNFRAQLAGWKCILYPDGGCLSCGQCNLPPAERTARVLSHAEPRVRLDEKYAVGTHASIRPSQSYTGTWIFLLPLPATWKMGSVFSGKARCA
jgi:hypothetical protein